MANLTCGVRMVILISVVLLSAAIVVIDAAEGGYGKDWNYDRNVKFGPDQWGLNHSHCDGKRQSPINIMTKDTIYNSLLGKLVLRNYSYAGDDVYFLMKNRNTDIAMEAKTTKGRKYPPQEIDFKGSTYRFYQYHFHWGSVNYQGSEHLIDSQQFAAELHMIHYNTKYENVLKAMKMSDGLLVWGHLLKVQSMDKDDEGLQDLVKEFKGLSDESNSMEIPFFPLTSLLPPSHDDFYYYLGSLTTPGCYESVSWIVNRSPISISQRQMGYFRQLKDMARGSAKPLANNYRPTQDLNGRVVERNFKYGYSSETGKSSATENSKLTKITMIFMNLVLIYLLQ